MSGQRNDWDDHLRGDGNDDLREGVALATWIAMAFCAIAGFALGYFVGLAGW